MDICDKRFSSISCEFQCTIFLARTCPVLPDVKHHVNKYGTRSGSLFQRLGKRKAHLTTLWWMSSWTVQYKDSGKPNADRKAWSAQIISFPRMRLSKTAIYSCKGVDWCKF